MINKTTSLTPVLPKYRLIWEAVEDAALVHLHRDIKQLVSQAEDTFFNASLKAKTSKEQNQYYQAVKAFQQQSTPLEKAFCQEIKPQILHLGNPNTAHKEKPLSLLSDAELEQNVALSATTSRLLAETVLEREMLYGYLRSLLPSTIEDNFWEEHCPFSPSNICSIFGQAILPLKIPAGCQLTFLKLFEQAIIKSLAKLYLELNQFLADNGIALTDKPSEHQHQIEKKNHRSILKKQLASLRTLGVSAPDMSFTYKADVTSSTTNPASTNMLVDALKDTADGLQSNTPLSAAPIKNAVKHLMRSPQGQSVNHDDLETIHLLTLFFNTLLNNQTLSSEIRLQISRLQLPISILVLQQQDFFENHNHPARQLINLLGAIGKVCPAVSGDNRCILLMHITQSVSTLCENPALTTDDFIAACRSIETFNDSLQKKADKLSHRFALSLQGQVSYQKTQEFIDIFLYQSLQGLLLPETIMDFVTTEWRTVLIRIYLRSQKGNAWQIAKNTTDDLLQRVSNESTDKSATQFKALCQQIQQCIEIASAAGEPIFYAIDKINNTFALINNPAKHNTLNWVTLRPQDLIQLHHTKEEQQLRWKRNKQEERLDLRYQLTSESNRLKSGKLTVGDSVQFLDRFSDKTFRGTIAAQLKESNQFLFVDVNGFRLFEKSYQEITYELERQRAIIHEPQLAFEESIQQIQHRLQSLQNEATSLH